MWTHELPKESGKYTMAFEFDGIYSKPCICYVEVNNDGSVDLYDSIEAKHADVPFRTLYHNDMHFVFQVELERFGNSTPKVTSSENELILKIPSILRERFLDDIAGAIEIGGRIESQYASLAEKATELTVASSHRRRRPGYGVELNTGYWSDGVKHCRVNTASSTSRQLQGVAERVEAGRGWVEIQRVRV